MKESPKETPESDTPEMDAALLADDTDKGWAPVIDRGRDLERRLRAATTERDNALAELERVKAENVMLHDSLPTSSNRTRAKAAELLGTVLRHETGTPERQSSHGCVEVTNALRVVDDLIGDNATLRAELDRVREEQVELGAALQSERDKYEFMRGNRDRLRSELAASQRKLAEHEFALQEAASDHNKLERQLTASQAREKGLREALRAVPSSALPHTADCVGLRCTCWHGKRAVALAAGSE